MRRLVSATLILVALCLMGAASNPHLAVIARKNAGGGAPSYTLVDEPVVNSEGGFRIHPAYTYRVAGTTVLASETYSVTKVAVHMRKVGTPTGNITVHLYAPSDGGTTEGAPDDLNVTCDATYPIASVGATFEWVEFTFTGATAWTSGNYYSVVIDPAGGDASNYIELGIDTFVSNDAGAYTRGTRPPGATDDAANWSEYDSNGTFAVRTYKSP